MSFSYQHTQLPRAFLLLKNGTSLPPPHNHQGATCFCVYVHVDVLYWETVLLLRVTPCSPGGINESRIICVSLCVYVHDVSFRAPRKRCAYSHMQYSACVILYMCVACVGCMLLKAREIQTWTGMSGLKFTRFYYIFCSWLFHTSVQISGVNTYVHALDFPACTKSPPGLIS